MDFRTGTNIWAVPLKMRCWRRKRVCFFYWTILGVHFMTSLFFFFLLHCSENWWCYLWPLLSASWWPVSVVPNRAWYIFCISYVTGSQVFLFLMWSLCQESQAIFLFCHSHNLLPHCFCRVFCKLSRQNLPFPSSIKLLTVLDQESIAWGLCWKKLHCFIIYH